MTIISSRQYIDEKSVSEDNFFCYLLCKCRYDLVVS